MSIAAKINWLIATLAVLAGIVVTIFVGQRDYSYQRDAIVLSASSLVGSQPNLQLTFYFRDDAGIERTARDILAISPAIRRTVFFNPQGDVIASRFRSWAREDRVPDLSRLRAGLAPLEQGLRKGDGGSTPDGLSLLRKLSLGEKTLST